MSERIGTVPYKNLRCRVADRLGIIIGRHLNEGTSISQQLVKK